MVTTALFNIRAHHVMRHPSPTACYVPHIPGNYGSLGSCQRSDVSFPCMMLTVLLTRSSNQGPYKEDNKGWDVFARERNPTKALQVAVVLPTRKELRDRRRAAKTFSHDLKVESGKSIHSDILQAYSEWP